MFWYGEYFDDELPVVGVVGVAVLGDPRRAGQQQVEPPHVQQRHAAHQRAEQLRVLGQHDAHQQAAVAAALRAELLDGRDAALAPDPLRPRRSPRATRCRPSRIAWVCQPRAVLAAAADVGQHVGSAARQPQPAQHAAVARACSSSRSRRSRPAASVPGPVGVAVPDHEVRDHGAVLRRDEVLCHLDVGGVEERRRALDLGHSVPRAARTAAATGCRIRWSPGRSRRRTSSASTITVLVLGGMPGTGSRVQLPGVTFDTAGDVDESDEDQPVPRPRVVLQAGVLVGFEDDVQIRLCRRGIRRSWRPAASRPDTSCDPTVPVGARLGSAATRGASTCRHRWARRCGSLVAAQLVDLVVEEVDGPAQMQCARTPACGPLDAATLTSVLAAEQRLGLGRAACPGATA